MKLFCIKCGRKIENDSCVCVNKKDIKQIDIYLVLSLLMFIPLIINYIVLKSSLTQFDELNYMFYGNLSLVITLSVLVGLNAIFKTKHLVLFFNCHQRVNRSFVIFKKPYILCARCTGILVGVYFSLIITYIGLPIILYFIFGIPLVIDGLLQSKTNYVSNNLKRFFSGLLFSLTLVAFYSLFNYYLQYLIFNIIN
ncbi:hypothetical protein CI105_07560 [Candidatus Izimaplasma bacterium ZiA1]|nr:hypothetical protein CI105_07560 [Candidatus Izimaplasma bacterium ZiA1]